MRTTSIFATATSTIHTDLIVVGLRRVGISTERISVLYPSYSQPDTVLYWLHGAARWTVSPTGETVTVSGPLRFAIDSQREDVEFPSLVRSLRSLGLSEEESDGFKAALMEDRVVIAIEAVDDAELSLAVHILHHIGAEKIVLVEPEMPETRQRHKVAAFTLSAA